MLATASRATRVVLDVAGLTVGLLAGYFATIVAAFSIGDWIGHPLTFAGLVTVCIAVLLAALWPKRPWRAPLVGLVAGSLATTVVLSIAVLFVVHGFDNID